MPNCFQLYPKGSQVAAFLNTEVDPAIAAHLGVECDPKLWTADWYHVIGFLIACKDGCQLGSEKLRAEVCKWYDDDDSIYRNHVNRGIMPEDERVTLRNGMLHILDFLEATYSSDAFVQIGKR